MYNPKQIPQLLNQNYRKYLTYQEYHVEELQDYIMCIWRVTSKETLLKPIMNTVLPDGCIDLIIDINNQIMAFSGFSKNTEVVPVEGSVNFIGIRFKPGVIPAIFNVAGNKVMDHTIMFTDLEKEYDVSPIFKTIDTMTQIDILKQYLLSKVEVVKDKQYLYLVDTLYNTPTNQCVKDIGIKLGYQSRQLQRVFLKHYGVSPKVLLNILRLHKCLTLLFDNTKSLQDIALDSGFYDQAHFIKEIKRYTGILPTALLEEYKH